MVATRNFKNIVCVSVSCLHLSLCATNTPGAFRGTGGLGTGATSSCDHTRGPGTKLGSSERATGVLSQ